MGYSSREANPSAVISLSFLFAILLGALLLKLPAASTGTPLRFIDALFMTTSAVCVTGLSVVDLGRDLSFFGQTVILIWIQAGGLGIMTFSLFFFFVLRKKTSMESRMSLGGLAKRHDSLTLFYTLGFVLMVTLVIEAIGAGLLYLRFVRDFGAGQEAVFFSIFHAISGFCNAGLSLFSDSLAGYNTEHFILWVMMGLIIAGGIGFVVIDEAVRGIRAWAGRKPFHWSLHTRTVFWMTLALILWGALLIYLFEFRGVFKDMSWTGQVTNAFFQAVTPRTAGFNTVDLSAMSNASLFVIIGLMFIGAAPGSTAGGIKVTTFAVMVALILSQVRGEDSVTLLKRKISREVIGKAVAVVAASFLLINFVTLLLQLTETKLLAAGGLTGHRGFLDLLFETVSAFGTVGLSTGITPKLSDPGKLLIILTMFAGRVGPLTIGLAILAQKHKQVHFEYAEEDTMIG